MQDLSDDIEYAWRCEHPDQQLDADLRRLECLRRIELQLRDSNKSLRSFNGMPCIRDEQLNEVQAKFERDVDVDQYRNKLAQLNDAQRAAFGKFAVALENRRPLLLNLDAPGGTGALSSRFI